MNYKFKIGDRIKRLSKDNIMRHGVIVAVNQSYTNYKGEILILYAVKWDDTELIETGYMDIANGLEREETKLD